MFDPTIEAMVNALKGPQGVQLAGDVVPMPVVPQNAPAAPVHTPVATDYGWGLKTDPKVESIGIPTMTDWLRRAGERYR